MRHSEENNAITEMKKSVKEWMGYLRVKTIECKYKEKNRRLKEQNIYGINDDGMICEIIRELAITKKADKITCEQVMTSAKRT